MSILIDRGLLQQYPLDVKMLTKGDRLDKSTLEKVTGKTSEDIEGWNFALLALRTFIERESKKAGIRLIPAIQGNTIYINTDEDAAGYTERQATIGRRRFYRNHRRQMDIDMSQLSDETRKRHERNLITNGRMIANMHVSREIPKPVPHKEIGRDEKGTEGTKGT